MINPLKILVQEQGHSQSILETGILVWALENWAQNVSKLYKSVVVLEIYPTALKVVKNTVKLSLCILKTTPAQPQKKTCNYGYILLNPDFCTSCEIFINCDQKHLQLPTEFKK